MLNETECEALAKKACEGYMNKCDLKNLDEARLASQKMLAMAEDLFKTLHDETLKMDPVQ